MKILLIEDEKELRQSIITYLSHEGYVCEVARDFPEGQEKMNTYAYDCFIIDLMMPGGNGLDLVKEIKTKNIKGGIIIISAKDTLDDRIKGLDLGSDDYLTKPFHLSELNARLKSIVRRRQFDGNTDIIFNEIRLIPENHEVFVNDTRVTLTGKEFDLLLFFVSNKGRVLPKDSIAEHIWGDHMDQSNSFDFIYTHIKNMRRKLVDAGCKDYLTTVYGIGYKFQTE
ncbi:response regulator transcription factor [Cytophaga aurantiaca]|uniref:response regulator transcription factor n=1 Tax=Cytophaga aurantiaca TaxID=29530 RepID=UPI00035FF094|nr:response regulator transcription factor [Cytophaga aurantiaca]